MLISQRARTRTCLVPRESIDRTSVLESFRNPAHTHIAAAKSAVGISSPYFEESAQALFRRFFCVRQTRYGEPDGPPTGGPFTLFAVLLTYPASHQSISSDCGSHSSKERAKPC